MSNKKIAVLDIASDVITLVMQDSKFVDNYTVYHANVGELQKICKIDTESIVNKIKENYEN